MSRSLDDWLAHQAALHPQTIDLGLERVAHVLDRLGWHRPPVPVITVAGTNGKGSVTEYCRSILGADGRRVGTFTSPHLRSYRERVRIHDRFATDAELVGAFEAIDAARGDISLTFFEFNTIAALLLFTAAGLDAWVLEVGMGGRLDAVNVVDAEVAVVVSVGLDHQEFLGNTLDAIAREKAGVFRRGRPAVIGSRTAPPALLEAAAAIGAAPKRLGVEFDFEHAPGAANWRYRGSRWDFDELPAPALAGATQFVNAAAAIAALEALDVGLLGGGGGSVARGLVAARLVGRFQTVAPGPRFPTFILDVAHNPDAARVLRENLATPRHAGRTLAVCGILADKDAPAIAAELADCFDAWWLVSTEGARGSSAAALAERVSGTVTAPLTLAEDVAAACAAATAAATALDRIVIFGSFHIVGPALDWLEARGFLPPEALPEYTVAPRGS